MKRVSGRAGGAGGAGWLGWLLAVVVLVGSPLAAWGAAIPFGRDAVSYRPQEEPLRQFLTTFFADQGLSVTLSPPVATDTATVNDPLSGPPATVFERLARRYQLIAYYDGAVVHVYRGNERITRYLSVPANRTASFARALASLGLADRDNRFQARADTGLIEVSGVPRFVEQIESLTRTIQAQGIATPAVVRSFPLRFAAATDTTVTIGGRNLVMPGVARLLQQLVGGAPGISPGASSYAPGAARRATRLTGGAPPAFPPPGERPGAADDPYAVAIAEPPVEIIERAALDDGTRFIADPMRNAVIVRCPPDSLPVYEELIRSLDVEPRVVEIEAAIIDVNRRKARDIGVGWRYRNNGGRGAIGFDPSLDRGGVAAPGCNGVDDLLCALLGGSTDVLPQRVPGMQIGAILGDSYRFVSRINLLAERGVTNVVARPQVVTLNGMEALVENSRELYVPVAGSYTVDLFNVVASTTLRVTPSVVLSEGRQRIRLAVSIEDGNVTLVPARVSGPERLSAADVPLVTRNGVSTQAIIEEGESLLLGGLIREQSMSSDDKVPGLGDIPVIGRAFRREQRERERNERLFLITPRLVALSRIHGQSVPPSPAIDLDTLDRMGDLPPPGAAADASIKPDGTDGSIAAGGLPH